MFIIMVVHLMMNNLIYLSTFTAVIHRDISMKSCRLIENIILKKTILKQVVKLRNCNLITVNIHIEIKYISVSLIEPLFMIFKVFKVEYFEHEQPIWFICCSNPSVLKIYELLIENFIRKDIEMQLKRGEVAIEEREVFLLNEHGSIRVARISSTN